MRQAEYFSASFAEAAVAKLDRWLANNPNVTIISTCMAMTPDKTSILVVWE